MTEKLVTAKQLSKIVVLLSLAEGSLEQPDFPSLVVELEGSRKGAFE